MTYELPAPNIERVREWARVLADERPTDEEARFLRRMFADIPRRATTAQAAGETDRRRMLAHSSAVQT